MHATWNFLLAGARDTQAATAVALLTAQVAFAIPAWLTWDVHAAVWPFLLASGLLQLLYFSLLVAGYRIAPLSVVYPIARGVAPVVVLLGGVVVLGRGTSAEQVLGVLLVAAGVLLVRGIRAPAGRGVVFGLATACVIASYTLVDKHGIAHAAPIPYNELEMIVPSLVYAGFVARTRGGEVLRSEVRPAILLAGFATFGAYLLVLYALQRAPAAPVAAVRESGVLVATALGALYLRERVTPWRACGAVLVVAGIALVSLG